MLRLTTVTTCLLLLVVISCSRAKKAECSEATDPRTGECLSLADPNVSRIATLQAQLEAQTQQIQQMIQQDQAKRAEILRLRNTLNDPNVTESQKDEAKRKLGDLGINVGVAVAAKGGQAFLHWLDGTYLGLTPAPVSSPSTPEKQGP